MYLAPCSLYPAGKNTTNQNALLSDLYEKAYGSSLGKALKGKCGDRLHYALSALLQTKATVLQLLQLCNLVTCNLATL